jgi:hypothetical protein
MIRLYSYLTAIILTLGIGCAQYYTYAQKTQATLNAVYLRGLGELSESMTGMTNTLIKCSYASSPSQLAELSAKLWRDSAVAKTTLASLPGCDANLDSAYRFFSQAGEYAMTLSQKLASGLSLTEEEQASLVGIRSYAQGLAQSIYDIEQNAHAGDYSFVSMGNVPLMPRQTDEQIYKLQSAAFEDAGNLDAYAKLIYDGPFSDHMLEVTPRMTQNVAEISQEEALTIAQRVCGDDQLAYTGDENSAMPSYCFQDSYFSLGITKNAIITSDDAIVAGKEFLAQLGIKNMEPTYFSTENSVCTINFANVQDGVICYPDLIKVGVAMDNREVVFIDARGYLVNHYERELSPADETVAQKHQESLLGIMDKVIYAGRAIIPTAGRNERLCDEFLATDKDGRSMLIYTDAQTGEQRQILILIETGNGVLTV